MTGFLIFLMPGILMVICAAAEETVNAVTAIKNVKFKKVCFIITPFVRVNNSPALIILGSRTPKITPEFGQFVAGHYLRSVLPTTTLVYADAPPRLKALIR